MKLEVKIHTYKKVAPRKFHARIESKILSSLFARDEKEDRRGEERKKERGGGREWINQPCVETIARAEEPGHQDRNAPRRSVSREEVQEAGSPFNLAPIGGRRNGSNTVRPLIRRRTRCRLRNFFLFFFYSSLTAPPKGLNHACAHGPNVLKENRSRSMHSRGLLLLPPPPPPF